MITSISQLYFFEKSENDSFRVKKLYIDIADDLVAGILLGQIIYWFLPDKSGNNKLKIEREGKLWLAKKREDWFEEIRITPKQFDRAISILKAKGLVEVKNFKFNGAPTLHIHLHEEKLLEEVNKFYREYQTNVCNENGNSSEGKMDFTQTSKSSSDNDFETHEKQEMEAEQENNWDNASKPLGDMDFTQKGKWILPKGQNGFYPKGKMDFTERSKSTISNINNYIQRLRTEITNSVCNNSAPNEKTEENFDNMDIAELYIEILKACAKHKISTQTAFALHLKTLDNIELRRKVVKMLNSSYFENEVRNKEAFLIDFLRKEYNLDVFDIDNKQAKEQKTAQKEQKECKKAKHKALHEERDPSVYLEMEQVYKNYLQNNDVNEEEILKFLHQ